MVPKVYLLSGYGQRLYIHLTDMLPCHKSNSNIDCSDTHIGTCLFILLVVHHMFYAKLLWCFLQWEEINCYFNHLHDHKTCEFDEHKNIVHVFLFAWSHHTLEFSWFLSEVVLRCYRLNIINKCFCKRSVEEIMSALVSAWLHKFNCHTCFLCFFWFLTFCSVS